MIILRKHAKGKSNRTFWVDNYLIIKDMRGIIRAVLLTVVAITACLLTISSATPSSKTSSSYNVVCVYESVDIPSGSKALDTWSNLKEIKAVFVPTKINKGKYSVEVTRIDSNFYQICGTELYVETQYCYEYATREEVVLNITSNYNNARGEIIFF